MNPAANQPKTECHCEADGTGKAETQGPLAFGNKVERSNHREGGEKSA